MPTYVVPSWQLANIDPGQLFKNNGKLYMLIGHHALYTEISRYYWFDRLFASATDRIRALIRRIRIKKIRKGSEQEGESLVGHDQPIKANEDGITEIKSNNIKP